jgi:hypothetical protein
MVAVRVLFSLALTVHVALGAITAWNKLAVMLSGYSGTGATSISSSPPALCLGESADNCSGHIMQSYIANVSTVSPNNFSDSVVHFRIFPVSFTI